MGAVTNHIQDQNFALRSAVTGDAILSNSRFTNAKLSGTRLINTPLSGTRIHHATLAGMTIHGVKVSDPSTAYMKTKG
jgi:uncharacterized protein YjbI with pentapeptide repeats